MLKIIQQLDFEGFEGCLAIVDADFDHLALESVQSSNLLRTDSHDLETLMIQSPALEKVVVEFGSEEKLKNFEADLRQCLLTAAKPLGYLVWHSSQANLGLRFEGIDFGNFINEKTLQVNETKLIQTIKNKSQKQSLKDEELQKAIKDLEDPSHDLWQVCRGHDLTELLSLGLRKTIGTNNSTDVKPEILERALRLAYEFQYLHATKLYGAIVAWEKQTGYSILALDPSC